MIRLIAYILMVSSFFVMGGLDLSKREWRLGISAVLLGIVQLLIFRGK